jgi:hypothetical protein
MCVYIILIGRVNSSINRMIHSYLHCWKQSVSLHEIRFLVHVFWWDSIYVSSRCRCYWRPRIFFLYALKCWEEQFPTVAARPHFRLCLRPNQTQLQEHIFWHIDTILHLIQYMRKVNTEQKKISVFTHIAIRRKSSNSFHKNVTYIFRAKE